jgi:enediyne biosynthesis protein E4
MRRWAGWFAGGLAVGVLVGAGTYAVAGLGVGDPTGDGDEPAVARFVEETSSSGVRQVYDGGFTFYVGGGVATFDCDGDRRPDLYVAGGQNAAGLFRNHSDVGGGIAFTPLPDPATDLTGVTGAYPVDVDSDGVLDLAVLRFGENVMLRGLGECRFERANEVWGIDGDDEWTVAFSATWEGDNALPTLAFGNYLETVADEQNARDCVPSQLLRPDGGGSYSVPMQLAPGRCALSVLFSDWNATGRSDLRMANDRHYYTEGSEQLWRVEPGAEPSLYTAADGWNSLSIWGMGIATADVSADGLPEVVITSQGDNKMQTLVAGPERPTYDDIAIRTGTTAHRPFMGDATYPSTAWHPELADVNNDGMLDLYLSKGNVDSQGDHAADDPSNLMLGRPDGTFVESAREAGVVSLGLGRGAALVDLNLDGLLDLVEVNRNDNVRVWRNVGGGTAENAEPMGSWVALALEQPAPNVDAIGAWIEVRHGDGTTRRQVTLGGGHASGHVGWVHVGLGSAETAQVRVRWPDGHSGEWLDVPADTFAVIERGAARAVPWTPSG